MEYLLWIPIVIMGIITSLSITDMKPIIIETKFLPNGIAGITLYPFILVKNKYNKRLVNHELIHIEQQKELFVIAFYVLYLLEYFKKGYRGISFEKEAYENQYDYTYLETREPHSYKKYK